MVFSKFKSGLRLSLLCGALLAVSAASADYIPPGEVEVKTADFRGEPIRFTPGTYYYDITWQGIPVGSAQVATHEREIDGARFLYVEAKARTNGPVSIFYKLRHTSESIFRADNLKPLSFYSEQNVNSTKRVRHVSFRPNGEILTRAWKNGKEEEQILFRSTNLTLDPISASFLARSLSVHEGRTPDFDVFNGKHRYLIGFDVISRETTRVEGKKHEAFRVKPAVKKLTDTEGEKRLKDAFLWISTDGNNEILKLESEVLIGSIVAELDHFEPATAAEVPPPPALQARLQPAADDPGARGLFSIR